MERPRSGLRDGERCTALGQALRAKARRPLADASQLTDPGGVSGRRLYSSSEGAPLDA